MLSAAGSSPAVHRRPGKRPGAKHEKLRVWIQTPAVWLWAGGARHICLRPLPRLHSHPKGDTRRPPLGEESVSSPTTWGPCDGGRAPSGVDLPRRAALQRPRRDQDGAAPARETDTRRRAAPCAGLWLVAFLRGECLRPVPPTACQRALGPSRHCDAVTWSHPVIATPSDPVMWSASGSPCFPVLLRAHHLRAASQRPLRFVSRNLGLPVDRWVRLHALRTWTNWIHNVHKRLSKVLYEKFTVCWSESLLTWWKICLTNDSRRL